MIRRSLIAITLILAVVGLAYLWKNASPSKDDAKLKELREIVADLQVFPDFIEDATDETSRATDAGVYKYYCSAATQHMKRSRTFIPANSAAVAGGF
jgi:hypothetical protein